jgi:hypothetical protein
MYNKKRQQMGFSDGYVEKRIGKNVFSGISIRL